MADKKLMIDTSILIDYFRKSDKANARLIAHFRQYNRLYISSITQFEVYNGATEVHKQFWEQMLLRLTILDFDGKAARQAAEIVGQLKTKQLKKNHRQAGLIYCCYGNCTRVGI